MVRYFKGCDGMVLNGGIIIFFNDVLLFEPFCYSYGDYFFPGKGFFILPPTVIVLLKASCDH